MNSPDYLHGTQCLLFVTQLISEQDVSFFHEFKHRFHILGREICDGERVNGDVNYIYLTVVCVLCMCARICGHILDGQLVTWICSHT